MLQNSNLIYLVLVILPALLYSFLISLTLLSKVKIHIITWVKFILNGIISTYVITSLHYTLPNWSELILPESAIVSLFFLTFIQIALLEEVAKFLLARFSLSGQKILSFNETMFYVSLSSVGFAIAENLQYIQIHGEQIIFMRIMTATIAHIMFGIFMGYFYAISKEKNNYFYQILAIIFPTIAHGIYDFNCFLNSAFPDVYTETIALEVLILILQIMISLGSYMILNRKNKI